MSFFRLQLIFLFIASSSFDGLCAETIEEKMILLEDNAQFENANSLALGRVNRKLSSLRTELQDRYRLAEILIEEKAEEDEYFELLEEINILREEIQEVEGKWRVSQVEEMITESESYGILEHEDVTLSQLIFEYGSQDYLYIIPPEVASLKLHLHSAIMIPRESWTDLLEGILKYNGVGIKKVNTYTKQLYLLKQNLTAVNAIVVRKLELEALDDNTRVAFVLSPNAENLRPAFYFLERLRNPKTTFIYQVGQKIAIVGFKRDVKKLVTLCDNVWSTAEEKVTKVITTSKIQPEEIVKILKSYFGGLADTRGSMMAIKGGHNLSVFPLASEGGVILIGSRSVVERAERIINETQAQVDDPYELTVFWYTCSHSKPEELAEILDQVYSSLIYSGFESSDENGLGKLADLGGFRDPNVSRANSIPGYPMNDPNGAPPWYSEKNRRNTDRGDTKNKPSNFIPYSATGSILMVVRKDTLSKLKEVIKKLDIPKRMVEIEVLLVERRITNSSRSGINLLKLGSKASDENDFSATFNETDKSSLKGLLEFCFSSKATDLLPKLDLTWGFLLSQEGIRVTASPSVLMINQTSATISITDQISINNGASPVSANNGVVFKNSYDRADFGITITLTPTVHEPELDDPSNQLYITLENDISFESIKGDRKEGRPDVHKRQIQNQVRIPDGQTIILGGLRSKTAEDKKDKIPFLGEIPGIGKLFGTAVSNDNSNEMFIFIKPKVISDPKHDLLKIREKAMKKRAGDIALLLGKIHSAREKAKARCFSKSLDLFIERGKDESLNF